MSTACALGWSQCVAVESWRPKTAIVTAFHRIASSVNAGS